MIRGYPWESSPLAWTPSLRTTVDLMLAAQAEIVLFCGPEFAALYNAYAPTIGDKYPRALGRPARENWAERWSGLDRDTCSKELPPGAEFSAAEVGWATHNRFRWIPAPYLTK